MEEKKETKVREDLNDMVKTIGLKKYRGRYADRYVCEVTLFNGEVISFRDTNGNLAKVLNSYQALGLTKEQFLKSKKLVEEVKSSVVDAVDGVVDEGANTYFCVKYVLTNGVKERVFRLFPDNLSAYTLIENFYDMWHLQKKNTQQANNVNKKVG